MNNTANNPAERYVADAGAAKVLVVDDEQDIVEVLSYLLKKSGYEVETAQTGREAISVIMSDHIGVVLLDYMLPDINGLEVLKEIKAFSSAIQVLIITGRGSDKVLSDVLAAGAAGYVVKPFLNERLMELVRDTYAKYRAAAAADSKGEKG